MTADCVVSAGKTVAQLHPVVAAGTCLHFEEVSKEEGSHRSLSTHEEVEGWGFGCEWLQSSLTGRLWQWREQTMVLAVVVEAAADVVQ